VISEEVARLRREYEAEGLVEATMADDPMTQFESWFAGVVAAGLPEPNAFVLATVDPDGTPSARALLMKGLEEDGLVFYTGSESRKSQAMRSNGRAAATFVWIPLHRQVRFEGTVAEVDPESADAYFATRPRGAQIAAHASLQSEPVGDRAELDRRFARLEAEFGDSEISRPPHWGGWKLTPRSVEFWQGQPNRFHDRVVYRKSGSGWSKRRLSP
jgi:pyridoxamine 5'-phosphate oxidase